MGSPTYPNFTSPPNVGPEPAGLLQSVREKIFGAAPPPPPDPYALTDAQHVQLLTDTKGFCEPGRELFEYGWWRNLLYLLGRQWIYWNPTGRQWQDKRLAKWIPKPVTNFVRTSVLAIRSITQAIDLGVAVRPQGQSPANVTTAQTLDDLEPSLRAEHDVKNVWRKADLTAALFGNAYIHVWWDPNDTTHTAEVDAWTCGLCGAQSPSNAITAAGQACPACGSQTLTQAGPTQTSPVGKGKTLVATPLELLLPIYAQAFAHVDRLIYLSWTPKHQIEDEMTGRVDPATGKPFLDRIVFDQGPQHHALQMYKTLATTSDLTISPSIVNTGAYSGQTQGITELHLWIKPCKTYPQGYYMRFLGESSPVPVPVLDAQGQPQPAELPYKTVLGVPLWPWVDYPYELLDGRLYAMSAVDAIIQKQDQINQLDSMAQMGIQRMGNPIWLEPKGANVERFTGEPGMVVKWQPLGANGGKPERLPGDPVNPSIFTLREQLIADIDTLVGTSGITQGEPAGGGDQAFSALQLRVEIAQGRFKTLFASRAEAYQQWYGLVVELERMYGPHQRTQAVLGPNKAWTFQTFLKADLQGDVDIAIEDGSNIPKTALGRRAAIEHASQLQLLNPHDPEQKFLLYAELGLSSLAPSLDADVMSALQEQQAFEDWAASHMNGPCPLIRYEWQDDQVHLVQNRMWMNGDAIRQLLASLPPPQAQQMQQVLTVHLAEHAAGAAPPPPDLPKVQVSLVGLDLQTNEKAIELLQKCGIQITALPPGAGQIPGTPGTPGALGEPAGPGTPPTPGAAPGRATPAAMLTRRSLTAPHPAPNGGSGSTIPRPPQAAGAARAMANSNQNSGVVPPSGPAPV